MSQQHVGLSRYFGAGVDDVSDTFPTSIAEPTFSSRLQNLSKKKYLRSVRVVDMVAHKIHLNLS